MTIDFLIIGAQKAATTSLQGALRTIPNIYMPEGESAVFEDPDFQKCAWNEVRPPPGSHAQVVGIKRPDLLCREDLLERVAATVPQARLIIVLRDPISRAVSAYFHMVRHGRLPNDSLEVGLRKSVDAFEARSRGPASSVIRFGLYGESIAKWLEHYQRDRLLVVGPKQVTDEMDVVVERCCSYLGLPPAELVRTTRDRSNSGLFDRRLVGVYQRGHLLKTHEVPLGAGRREPHPSFVRRLAGGLLTGGAQQMARFEGEAPKLGTDLRETLADIYRPDLRVLLQHVDPSVANWSFDPQC